MASHENIANGRLCQLCLKAFKKPNGEPGIYTHGYMVVCEECYEAIDSTFVKENYIKADKGT
jgi:hypothetical protein